MKIFLDANILFTAAHNPQGKSRFLIDIAASQKWTPATCALAIEEAERNLQKKFPHCLTNLKKSLRLILLVPTIAYGDCPIALPDKDRPIFLSAHRSHCSHLLTGDLKDFGRHMNRPTQSAGVLIQTVGEFLNDV